MKYRTTPQLNFWLDELVVDNFAGGGGASTGIEQALGRPVDIAINHDIDAIKMHEINHPHTKHYCESVWDINPHQVTNGQPVGLAWFSPDCKHFSKAKGSTPVKKEIRGLAWVAVRWAATAKPRIIVIENVEEFVTWGPVIDGKPCPANKGKTFKSFVNKLESLGYNVEWQNLTASDFGAPTSRKRFFLIARCDGQPITWPQPTHGNPAAKGFKSSGLKKWKTAADIIDWSIPCKSIFERKRPLAENTLKRIARGIQRFIIDNPKPFIVRIGQQGFGGNGMQYKTGNPITTITTKAEHCLVMPQITKHYGGNYTGAGSAVNSPLHTITTVDHNAIVATHLIHMRNNCDAKAITNPVPTLTAGGGHVGEVRAFLIKYYGNEKDGCELTTPPHTVTAQDRFGLITVKGEKYQISDIQMRMLEPHELFAAQGFPADYIISKDAQGKAIPKYKQVARCGNSVCPPIAQAIVAANYTNINTKQAAA